MDNVLLAGKGVRFYINFEECMNKVFGMKPLQHPVGIKSIDVEAPQHLPTSEVIDDFKQRLFLVTFHESLKKTGSFFKQHTTPKSTYCTVCCILSKNDQFVVEKDCKFGSFF
jgi:hypothetical protein